MKTYQAITISLLLSLLPFRGINNNKDLESKLLDSQIPQHEIKQTPKKITAYEFPTLPSTEYHDISHSKIEWINIADGLDFSRVEVYRGKKLVDIISTVKIDPNKNAIKVFNGYNANGSIAMNIEKWQKKTGATVMINSAQYMGDPYYMPCGLIIQKGKFKGPKHNKAVRGMLVSEPNQEGVPKADLLDFKYDHFDYKNTPYQEGVQHWMMLLDKKENIRVNKSSWQANRTVVAKDWKGNILFMTTEGGYFTLSNLGRFFKETNHEPDKGYNIKTAMNMDGGYEADMVIKSNKLEYITYGEFETYGPGRDATVRNWKINIPGVIGVFPRKKLEK